MKAGLDPNAVPVRRRRTTVRGARFLALALLAMMAFDPAPARAAVTEAWVQRYNSNALNHSQDGAFKVVRDAAGDIMVVGSTRDDITSPAMLLIKYSGADGSVLWQKRYSVLVPYTAGNIYDRIVAAAVDHHGDLLITGSSFGNYYTAKYAGLDGALLWTNGYNGPANGPAAPWSQAVDADGNVVVTGSSENGIDNPEEGIFYDSDYYTAKYAAADGALLWEKRYSGPANSDDFARSVAVDANGNVAVTGFSHDPASGYDFYTAKYAAANGALLWEKRYQGSSSFYALDSAAAVDANGNVVVTGTSFGGASGLDYYTAKYDAADGALLWEKRYNGPSDDRIRRVAVDGSGNVVVTGTTAGDIGDFYTVKYAAANGALLWEQRYNGPGDSYDQPFALAVDGGGSVVVTGYSYSGAAGNYYTARYAAANGALIWTKRSGHIIQDLAVAASGEVVATGEFSNDAYTARYAAADGALVWEKRYDGPANRTDQALAVAVDAAGNVVVTGESDSDVNYDYYTAKYAAADGALLWEQRYDGPVNSSDKAKSVGVDSSGNVVVTGSSYSDNRLFNISQDFYTAKYSAADGALLWGKRGPANSYAQGQSVAVDSGDNVIVTGSSFDGTKTDFYTAKYAAANGALLWEKRQVASGYNSNPEVVLAVDGGGNVVVAGTSNGAGGSDYYTAKYASADGALLWEKRYDGPTAYSEDQVTAVAVDANGNVVVTGTSGSDYLTDYYTARYAAADGALLWEKRYDGPANSADAASDMAVDAGGNVVVTGYSYGTSNFATTSDYYTAKYAASNGALLWEKRYNGPHNIDEFAQAVAVDVSGNVVVTGQSGGDAYSAKYAAADGALLWERRLRGLVIDGSRSLAAGPDGMVAITGASDGGNRIFDYATVVYREIPGPASFAVWMAGFGLSGAAATAAADPDHDGIPNAAEFVLGGNPGSPVSPQPPVVTISGDSMLLTFFRADTSETPDIFTLAVETSADLVNWPAGWPATFFIGLNTEASSAGVTIVENGTAPDTITVAISQGTAARKFARLKVTIMP